MGKKKVGIIGGGIVGSALAYFLTQYPEVETTLFEKNSIGSGTTSKSAGTVCLFDDSLSHEFWPVRLFGFQTYTGMEAEDKGSAGFQKTGTLVVATDKIVEDFILEGIDKARAAGYQAEYLRDPAAIAKIIPDLNLEEVIGAGYTADDGFFDPTQISNTFATKARQKGVKVLTYTQVTGITLEGKRARGIQTTNGDYELDVVVNAAGPWALTVGEMAGLKLPIYHTKAEVFVLEPRGRLGYGFPVLKYPRFYARKEGNGIFICKAHLTMDLKNAVHAGVWDPDKLPARGGTEAYFLEFLMDQLSLHYPRLTDSSVMNDWVGYRAETPDFLPILGETPVEGFLLAAGCGGNGVIEAPAIGRDVAKYIATGEKTPVFERLAYSRLAEAS